MEMKVIEIEKPEDANVILGQSHFIKTVEDIYEAMAASAPNAKFGVGFCESSGACLVRSEGNEPGLKLLAAKNAMSVGAGHFFIVIMKDAYPINVLRAIKEVPEVCSIFCATANPVGVVVLDTPAGRAPLEMGFLTGRGVLGVVDGAKPKGVEDESGVKWRKELLRKLGYKL